MIDDDHRVVLKSISDGVNCEHDYVNASYIDVRDTIMCYYLINVKVNRL